MGHTDWFSVNQGLKQGSVLLPVLSDLVMENMIKTVKKENMEKMWTMIFTDDIIVWGDNYHEMQHQLSR